MTPEQREQTTTDAVKLLLSGEAPLNIPALRDVMNFGLNSMYVMTGAKPLEIATCVHFVFGYIMCYIKMMDGDANQQLARDIMRMVQGHVEGMALLEQVEAMADKQFAESQGAKCH